MLKIKAIIQMLLSESFVLIIERKEQIDLTAKVMKNSKLRDFINSIKVI